MVEFRPEQISGAIVTGFTRTGFKVGESRFDGGLLLTPENAIAWDAPRWEHLDLVTILQAMALPRPPEFLVLGSGQTLIQPTAALRSAAAIAEIGLETMDSRAAARTWGLLRAEERWIAAALLPFG